MKICRYAKLRAETSLWKLFQTLFSVILNETWWLINYFGHKWSLRGISIPNIRDYSQVKVLMFQPKVGVYTNRYLIPQQITRAIPFKHTLGFCSSNTWALKACPNMTPNSLAYCSDLPVSVAYRTVALILLESARPKSLDVNFTARAICLKWNFLFIGLLPVIGFDFCHWWVFHAGSWGRIVSLTVSC